VRSSFLWRTSWGSYSPWRLTLQRSMTSLKLSSSMKMVNSQVNAIKIIHFVWNCWTPLP
jgi:hypothetical protein